MKASVLRRLEALEERRARWAVRSVERISTTEAARLIAATLRQGVEAKEQLEVMGEDVSEDIRAPLTKAVEVARHIASLLRPSHEVAKEIR